MRTHALLLAAREDVFPLLPHIVACTKAKQVSLWASETPRPRRTTLALRQVRQVHLAQYVHQVIIRLA